MYLSLIITFLLLLTIIITSVQNSSPLELNFIFWTLQMSLTALIFWSSLFGGAIVAVLTLPNLVRKFLVVRGQKKEIDELKKSAAKREKQNEQQP